jgi:sugar phosphate permease
LFLLFGLITILIGILVFLFLPDSPMKSGLTIDEKIHIIERVRANETGVENKQFKWMQFKWMQFKEVIMDGKTWLISLIVITTNIPNGAVSSFSSIIIERYA